MIRVLHYVSVMDRGGQETFIMNVFRNIDRSKIQFDFLCSSNKKGDYDDEIIKLGGKIIHLNIEMHGNKISKYINYGKDRVSFLKTIVNNYDIVHLHNYHAFTSYLSVKDFEKAGFKHIILHSHNTSAPRIWLHKIFKSILARDKKIVRYACSNDAGKWMHGNKPFDVIYNGVDVSKFSYDEVARKELREQLGLQDNYVIGMVGRFNYQKNHMFALDVFAKCVEMNPMAKLVLVGKGELEEDIKAKISALSIEDKVLILGTRDDVDKLMSAFDVLFMPSIFEGLGIVLVEAQYTSLPIVASDVLVDEVFVSNCIKCFSLDEDLLIWAKALLEIGSRNRLDNTIDNNNFDILNVAKDLSSRYMDIAIR